MATFKVGDLFHLGIVDNIHSSSWRIGSNPEMSHIICRGVGVGPDNDTFITDMKYETYPPELGLDGSPDDFNNGAGLYWNGDTPIYVECTLMNTDLVQMTPQVFVWMPNDVLEDGTEVPPHNPIDYDDIDKYTRKTV